MKSLKNKTTNQPLSADFLHFVYLSKKKKTDPMLYHSYDVVCCYIKSLFEDKLVQKSDIWLNTGAQAKWE